MSAQFYRPQRGDRGRSRLMYATALIIIIFLLDLVAGGRLRSSVRLGVSYVYVSLAQTGTSIVGSGIFTTRASLEEENAKLRAELLAYQEKDSAYSAMEDENARLRTLAGLEAKIHGRAASIV